MEQSSNTGSNPNSTFLVENLLQVDQFRIVPLYSPCQTHKEVMFLCPLDICPHETTVVLPNMGGKIPGTIRVEPEEGEEERVFISL